MARYDKENSKQVAIRMDTQLYELLRKDARENGRTLAQTIRYRLRQAYALRGL